MARSCSPDLLEDAKQHIGVEGALMGFVHDDSTVIVEVALAQCLAQEDTICHVLDDGLLRRDVLKANGIPDLQQKAACSDLAALPAYGKRVSGQQQPHCLWSMSDRIAQRNGGPYGGPNIVLKMQMIPQQMLPVQERLAGG